MKTDIKKHIKILFNDYLNDSSAGAEDNLVNKLTEFCSNIPTHKEETKTLPADYRKDLISFLNEKVKNRDISAFKNIHELVDEFIKKYYFNLITLPVYSEIEEICDENCDLRKFKEADCRVPCCKTWRNTTPLKPLSDEEIAKAANERSKNYKHNSTDAQLDFIIGARWVRDNFSLLVDNAPKAKIQLPNADVSKPEFMKAVDNTVSVEKSWKELAIDSTKQGIGEFCKMANEIRSLRKELEATKKECDFFATASNKHELEVVTLSEQVTSLTSQLSLYKEAAIKIKSLQTGTDNYFTRFRKVQEIITESLKQE